MFKPKLFQSRLLKSGVILMTDDIDEAEEQGQPTTVTTVT